MMSIKLSPKTDLKTKGKTRSKLETVSLIMFPIFFEGHIFLNIAVMCYPVIIRDLYATGRHELEDGVIANSDVVSGLAYRAVAVEDVKQAVFTSGRKREYICRKKLMLKTIANSDVKN